LAAKEAKEEAKSAPGPIPANYAEVIEKERKCLDLMNQIRDANARILRRGQSGIGPWGQMLKDTYNHVCNTCHQRRVGTPPPDSYFDAICAEPDVDQVCKMKWLLGEALDDYRDCIHRVSLPLKDHNELEILIRRSITQPDPTPSELDASLVSAIERAKRVLRAGGHKHS
jgi:hypothetical protein